MDMYCTCCGWHGPEYETIIQGGLQENLCPYCYNESLEYDF